MYPPRIDDRLETTRIAIAQSISRCDLAAAGSESARRLTTIDAPENKSPIARKPRNRRASGPTRPTENQPSENHIYLLYMKFEHVYCSKVAQAKQISF